MFFFFPHCRSVLLADKNVVKISDFGTCRTWNEISVEMSFIGTYAWMAPEVIRKELCSEKMDVWYVLFCFFAFVASAILYTVYKLTVVNFPKVLRRGAMGVAHE